MNVKMVYFANNNIQKQPTIAGNIIFDIYFLPRTEIAIKNRRIIFVILLLSRYDKLL